MERKASQCPSSSKRKVEHLDHTKAGRDLAPGGGVRGGDDADVMITAPLYDLQLEARRMTIEEQHDGVVGSRIDAARKMDEPPSEEPIVDPS